MRIRIMPINNGKTEITISVIKKENNPEGIRFLLTIVLENKIGRYWYKNDFGKILLDPDLVEIADEICNDYE